MTQTEREKMLANEPYHPMNPELMGLYQKARNLLHTFNISHPENLEQRREIVRELFGSIGRDFVIMQPFRCDYGCNIHAGENLYINYDCIILDCNKVNFGSNVTLGPKVQIYTAYHPIDVETRRSGLEMAAPITIGNDAWIGGGAIICPGVTIGDNTTIGAGSVVTKNIPANVIAVGNPCKVIKNI